MIKLYKVTETTGCVFEDGSDTRKDKSSFIFVSDYQPYTNEGNKAMSEEEQFLQHMADKCGDQDYSYEIGYSCIATLSEDDISEIHSALVVYFNFKKVD